MSLKNKIKLEGEKIILRQLKLSDAESIYKHINHKDIVKYTLNIPWPYKLEHAIQFIKKIQKEYKKKTSTKLGIILKEKNKAIGVMDLKHIDVNNKNAEIG